MRNFFKQKNTCRFWDTDTSLGHFNICSFTMLGQLQLSWALGYFKGQILSRDFRPDFKSRLNIINKILNNDRSEILITPCYRGWAGEFFHTKNFFIKFFLIFFQNQFIFCLTLLNYKSYLPVTYFNSKFIVIIFHHKFWKSSQLSADKSVFNPLTSDYPTLRYIRITGKAFTHKKCQKSSITGLLAKK